MIKSKEKSSLFSASGVVSVVFHVIILGAVVTFVHPQLIEKILPKKTVVVELQPPPPPPPPPPPKELPKPPPKPQPPTPHQAPPPPQTLVTNAAAPINAPTIAPPPPPEPPREAPPEPPAPTKIVTGGVPDSYYQALSRAINGAVTYPPKSLRAGEEGTVKVRFHLMRDGTIKDVEVIEKSGFVALDAAAKEALISLGKFQAVPPKSDPEAAEFILTIPITFALSGDQ